MMNLTNEERNRNYRYILSRYKRHQCKVVLNECMNDVVTETVKADNLDICVYFDISTNCIHVTGFLVLEFSFKKLESTRLELDPY